MQKSGKQSDKPINRTSTPVRPVSSARSGLKESKSDHMSLSSHQKVPLQSKSVSSPMGKPYLSKSHENLSSLQKKKLTAYIEHRPKSSLGLPKEGAGGRHSNKENQAVRDKGGFLKPKPVKGGGLTPIRKASSTHNIDKSGAVTPTRGSSYNSRMQAMKRAHSSQNVSKEKQTRKRTSAPADVMAYNAELLANFEKDKKNLEARISELIQVAESRKAEIEKYKYETKRLKEQIPDHDLKDELQFLRNENQVYSQQLKELGYPVEQITDSEKLSRLQKSKNSKTGGDVSSVDLNVNKSMSCDSLSTDGARGAATTGSKGDIMDRSVTSEPGMSLMDMCSQMPENPSICSLEISNNWEKGSNKSSDALSEISVACLTERILQMEETHYSTNEELQATLQELGDLQQSVNELTDENERFCNEKTVLLESLCTQTEKLQHCRIQIEQLKSLLISGHLPDQSDREMQLIELLKVTQVEREELLRKQTELANALHSYENEIRELQDCYDALKDRSSLLEDKVTSINAEKVAYEFENTELKEKLVNQTIELAHYKTLLENEKTKVSELEQLITTDNKSDVEELLHNTRQEKDKLEEKCANTTESLQHSQREISKLRETLLSREEELKVAKNNAKTQVGDMEYRTDRLEKEKNDFKSEIESLRVHIDRLEQDCENYADDKKKLTAQAEELQNELEKLEEHHEKTKSELAELRNRYDQETEDWKQFQKDLQVAVLVANDFRAETQEDKDKIQHDHSMLQEKCNRLQGEVEKLKEELDRVKCRRAIDDKGAPSILSSAELKGKVYNTVGRELSHLRDKKPGDGKNASQSVKSLIRSIEEQVKSGCSSLHSSTCSSRRNSDTTDSSLSLQDMVKSPTSPCADSPQVFTSASTSDVTLRSALRKSDKASPIRHSVGILSFDSPRSPGDAGPKSAPPISKNETSPTITSILSHRNQGGIRRSSAVGLDSGERKESSGKDPLAALAKQMGGSKRNALLKWCQQKTVTYPKVDITNFSSSWNDGLAFCSLLHSYLPDKIPFSELDCDDKRRNFNLAFEAAESVGISTTILNINDMVAMERPDWQAVMAYVTSIYKHFEYDKTS